jgi:SAM-dependent MidA family methyltransferase
MHYQRLSRQFQKAVDHLREIQSERVERQRRDLQNAAALLELHKRKGIPWEPSDHGFVFSREQVEAFSRRLMRLNESRYIEHVLFHMQPQARAASASF